jgi:hypothetical protein
LILYPFALFSSWSAAILAAGFGILPNPLRGRTPISKPSPCTRRVSGKMPETAAKMAVLPSAGGGEWIPAAADDFFSEK